MNHFDEDVAATYDEDESDRFDPAAVAAEVDLLVELAGPGGRALELAVGTGRVALPLAARGVTVAGIELSEPMAARLRAKPGGADVEVVVGDMTTARVQGAFDLAYLVFNTIGNMTTQEGQAAIFANVARHLRPGGCFLVESTVGGVLRAQDGNRFEVFAFGDEHVGIDEYDPSTQAMWSHHLSREPDGRWRLGSTPFRYTWPAELDLMARSAGLALRDRWEWYDRRPWTAASTTHVSVWGRPR